MTRHMAGHTILALLALSAACAKDPVGLGRADATTLDPQAAVSANRSGEDQDRDAALVAMRDDCDPRDPGWAPTGGCLRRRGNVDLAEFNAELNSPLSLSVIGHQGWRMDPSYRVLRSGTDVLVSNEGGRTHTFTEVAQFGGGRVPPLNKGLTPAPECAGATNIPAGGTARVMGLTVGNHKFQCCIHPWMRELVKVRTAQDDDRD